MPDGGGIDWRCLPAAGAGMNVVALAFPGLLTDRFLARARSPGVDLGRYLVMPHPPPPPVGLWVKARGGLGEEGSIAACESVCPGAGEGGPYWPEASG